ncbi:hypothetical protein BGY98DRAFT_984325, partial [Russula aff. rugulosa BPL654]
SAEPNLPLHVRRFRLTTRWSDTWVARRRALLGMEFSSVSGFFLLMDVGAALEYGFKQATGIVSVGFWVGCGLWCGRLAGGL